MNIIETKKLTKFYGKTLGIENLDLAIHEGEIFGFIGPNGGIWGDCERWQASD